MTVRQAVVAQFRKPEGLLGHLAGAVMARRASNRARNDWTVDLLELAPGERVLEFGSGPGLALAAAARKLSRGHVVGVDHSPVMIAQAGRLNRDALRDGRMTLVIGGLDVLEAWSEQFDKAFSVNVMQFLSDRAAAFRVFRGILRPGGLLVSTYMPRHRAASRADALAMAGRLTADLEEAGFTAIRIAELPLRPVPAVAVVGRKPSPPGGRS
jgi:SAM-dependent methyltransferase